MIVISLLKLLKAMANVLTDCLSSDYHALPHWIALHLPE